MESNNHYDVIVLGAGPAGLSAGIYLSRARLRTLILSNGTIGGQMILTHEIANYPGVETTGGYQIANTMKNQAKSFGCDIKTIGNITGLTLNQKIKQISIGDGRIFSAPAVVLAPGGRPRTLNVPGEDNFKGKGISYCATCDGDFFTGKEIVVVGGGNSALEEAVSLTKYATKVTIIHEFDHFQAFEHAVNEARSNPAIQFVMESTVTEFYGNERLEGVVIKNLKNGNVQKFSTNGAFVFIGYLPNTEFLEGKIDLNNRNEIITDSDLQTSIPGVFAAGDCITKKYRQITTAVADGTIAALSASAYVHTLKTEEKKVTEASLS